MQFVEFSRAVAKQFQAMTKTGLFRLGKDRDLLWETYLASFPAGSNPIYKTRTEHDCSCCRHFIKTVGDVVTVVNGKIVTIWDVRVGQSEMQDEVYQIVANRMAAYVRENVVIENIFLHPEATVGVAKSFQEMLEGGVQYWEHFCVNLPKDVVAKGLDIGPRLSTSRSTFDVMLRGLREISLDAVDTVLELIAQNSLYRGEEHTVALRKFRTIKDTFSRIPLQSVQPWFVWSHLTDVPPAIARIRNTAIGTLLVDLSEGKDMADAVGAFERMVAPTNYKRPTALVTKAMIQKAQAKVEELGFTSALERRYATIDDITINNILFADRAARQAMNVFDVIASGVPEKTRSLDKVEEVSVEDFITKILPKADSLELMVENRHAANLVSLVAPVDPTAKGMFKWPNNFSWSYVGEVTDSIKERVKKAGGKVTGDLCCRLAWDYADDLDFYMEEPNGFEIFYMNRRKQSPNGGELDLDANGADGIKSDPAENIVYTNRKTMRDGVYTLKVNNYHRRSDGKGFEVEIEFDGQTQHIVYDRVVPNTKTVTVATIQYSKANGFKVISSLPSTQTSKTMWGLSTQTFQKVNVVMLSPNHWDDRVVGNKHYFFMLEGCLNEGKARGFFNEFLTAELDPHRKVFEMVGSKMKTEESARQLSGLGFSSTQRNSILCRVKGSFARTIKITF